MDPAHASAAAPATVTFHDGLGERHRVVDRARNEPIEVLCLRGELTAVPSFEFSLRERVSHLSTFRHACYARVRSVERLKNPASTLALVSDDDARRAAVGDPRLRREGAGHARYRRRAVPAPSAGARGGDAARKRAGDRPRRDRAPSASSSRRRPHHRRRARAGLGHRRTEILVRSLLERAAGGGSRCVGPAALRPPLRRHADCRRRAVADPRPAAARRRDAGTASATSSPPRGRILRAAASSRCPPACAPG